MRQTHFLRRSLEDGEIQRIPFAPGDYQQAGVPYASVGGMPVLEAYQLVNNWNVSQAEQQYVFAVA